MQSNRFVLSSGELDQICSLISSSHQQPNCFDDTRFLQYLPVLGSQLPTRLQIFLNHFKYGSIAQGYCIISGFNIDDCALGMTPAHWRLLTNNDTCSDAVMALCLYSTLLGDLFGWVTQQGGRMVHDVLPIRSHEGDQQGVGSKEELFWHTEDAFHELRGDYVALMCLRNHDGIPTTIGKPDYAQLSAEQLQILFEPHYSIRPDNSHQTAPDMSDESLMHLLLGQDRFHQACQEMASRHAHPKKIAVLFGSKETPYLRIDPYFMGEPDNDEARQALATLIALIDASLEEVVLTTGDCVILDNYQVVHGRRSFTARYDGSDRWLKRLNIHRDIRKCHEVLPSKSARVIY